MYAPVCVGLLNSAALFAIFEANVSPPLKIENVNGDPTPDLDKIRVIAIVSPSARPRPSIEPAMTPGRPYGRTANRIISHRVDAQRPGRLDVLRAGSGRTRRG